MLEWMELNNFIQLIGISPINKIEYNDKALKYLDTNILICDYLSGNYYLTPTKEIISQTYINKGYNYEKPTIELVDKSNSSKDSMTINLHIFLS